MISNNQTPTTLLIGKEPQRGCLLVAVGTGWQYKKVFTMENDMSLPASVSRCLPNENMGHCKIDVNADGTMVLTNLKWQNVTYANGVEIQSVRIDNHSHIELGVDRFPLNLAELLRAAGIEPVFSILYLKQVWTDYDRQLLAMQLAERKKANMSRLQGILSMLAMLMAILPSLVDGIDIPPTLRIAILIGALAMAVYSFVSGMRTNDSFAVKKHQLDEQLYTQYVCPNPRCHHFMGMQPYIVIRQNKVCPYCRCKFTE